MSRPVRVEIREISPAPRGHGDPLGPAAFEAAAHPRLAMLTARCPAGGNCVAPYTGTGPTTCVKCGTPR